MKRNWLTRIRIKTAGFILGDNSAMFVSKRINELTKRNAYLELSDEELGMMFRHWDVVFTEAALKKEGDDRVFRSALTSHAVLWLASHAVRMNATSSDFKVSGSLDGGQTTSAWAVRVEEMPDGLEAECRDDGIVELEDGRITQLYMSFDRKVEFDKWRAENQSRREAEEVEIGIKDGA